MFETSLVNPTIFFSGEVSAPNHYMKKFFKQKSNGKVRIHPHGKTGGDKTPYNVVYIFIKKFCETTILRTSPREKLCEKRIITRFIL
jgi:hypothetical protein